jgi:agmatine deiminase
LKLTNTISPFVLSAFIAIALLFTNLTQAQNVKDEEFRFPAEFEKHEAIWMAWRVPPTDRGLVKAETLFQIINAIDDYVKIHLIIDHDSVSHMLHSEFKKRGINESQVQMFVFPNPYSNVRDPGPVFLKSDKGNLMIADMKWNFYGGASSNFSPAVIRIDTIDQYVAGKLNLPVRISSLASEGGNREFNGKGTMMAVEYSEMHRNKGWSRDSIEKELLRMFGQKRIIWLKQGTAEDDPGKTFVLSSGKVSTIGCNHIDEFARFASPTTILLAEVTKEESLRDEVHRISYGRLEENYRILKQAKDQDGKPFNIIRVPVPEMITHPRTVNRSDSAIIKDNNLPPEGGTVIAFIASSYLNFLITNRMIVMAAYWKPGRPEIMRQKDEQAKTIIERAFPGRKVVALNVEVLNRGGGGIHCATQQQPATR